MNVPPPNRAAWAGNLRKLPSPTALPAMAAERTPLKEKLPEAGELIPLIEGFPLLKTLLEMDDPWNGNPVPNRSIGNKDGGVEDGVCEVMLAI